LALFVMPLRAAEKAHLVLVAIDDSGSMKQSDPLRLRLEAATMLAMSAGPNDQFGAMRFGSDADWLFQAATHPTSDTISASLNTLKSSDSWTNFIAPLRLAEQYLQAHDEFSRNYDVNLVLVTDGAPDPGPAYVGGPQQNGRDAIQLARALGQRGVRVYTIGLGKSVQSSFLQELAVQANGFYVPARTAPELRDAFLKVVTRIFSLPAYEQIQGASPSTIHIGRDAGIIRAYLFRESSATTISMAEKPIFADEHVAAYDMHNSGPDIKMQLSGPTNGATVILCAQQPLAFEAVKATPAVLLADAVLPIQVQLLGSGEVQWGRLFMRDASVQLRLHSTGESDVVQPLYPDSATHSYRGDVPTSKPGEYDVTVRLESPYGAVDHFLGKLKVSDQAASLPIQTTIEYPSFLPALSRRLFATKIPLQYVLPAGSATIAFESAPGIEFSPQQTEVSPGRDQSVSLFTSDMHTSGTVAAPFSITWNNGQQKQVRHGVLTVQLVAQNPVQFTRCHWLAIGSIALLMVAAILLLPAPKLKGVLIVEQAQLPKRRVILDDLRTKQVVVSESFDRDVLDREHIFVRTGVDRTLFSMRMSKTNGQWSPHVERADGVPLDGPRDLKQGSKITVKDRDVTITYYAG
jgi:Mg-chelatase subunit ChlD